MRPSPLARRHTTHLLRHPRTRNGKVARLPKSIRDQLNLLLLDGVPYAEIIKQLGEPAQHLNEDNISTWKKGGYQDWLRERERLEPTLRRQEFAMDLAQTDGGSRIHEASLQLVGTHVCELLENFSTKSLKKILQSDPVNLTRFLNAVARISLAELKCERHRLAFASEKTKLEKERLPKPRGGLSPETLRTIEAELHLL